MYGLAQRYLCSRKNNPRLSTAGDDERQKNDKAHNDEQDSKTHQERMKRCVYHCHDWPEFVCPTLGVPIWEVGRTNLKCPMSKLNCPMSKWELEVPTTNDTLR